MAKRLTAAEHSTQAQQNEKFYRHLGGSDSAWAGWAATALFYVALHEASAALRAMKEPSPSDHKTRREQIRKRLPSDLHTAYDSLESLSRSTRYEGFKPSQARLAAAELALALVRAEIQKLGLPPY